MQTEVRSGAATNAPNSPQSAPAPANPSIQDRTTEFLIKHRWATVVPVVLPLSKVYDTYWRARHVYYRNWRNAKHDHAKRVRSIQQQIQRWRDTGKEGLLCTSRKSWQTVSVRANNYKKNNAAIDVELHDILDIDYEQRTVRVEPRVNMGQLSEALVRHGWTIPVVPELDDLTAGGLLLGYGIESSSHKYGLYGDTVRSVEIVLADGRVVECNEDENEDLFRALPWSYGALGFVTAITLPIIPCKKHVHLTYEPLRGLDAILARYEELITADEPYEFIEGLMYSRDEAVLIYGDFADLPRGEKANEMGRWYKPWFYKHAEATLRSGVHTEYMPLRDWYHRHTKSLYFHGELLVPFGNEPAFRYTLGWLMPPKVSFLKLTQTESFRRYRDERNVVQDVLVPLEHLKAGIEMFHREFECYPLWLCAHRTPKTSPAAMLQPKKGTKDYEMYVDIGAWQVPGFVKRGEAWNGVEAVKRMEAWLRAHRGYQCMYAVTEQTREEFWEMFDPELYEKMRDKWGARGAFMDVFDKVGRPHLTKKSS